MSKVTARPMAFGLGLWIALSLLLVTIATGPTAFAKHGADDPVAEQELRQGADDTGFDNNGVDAGYDDNGVDGTYDDNGAA